MDYCHLSNVTKLKEKALPQLCRGQAGSENPMKKCLVHAPSIQPK